MCLFFNLFIYGCAGSLLLCGLFSGCGSKDYSLVATHGLLIAGASLMVKHRLQVKGFGSCSA